MIGQLSAGILVDSPLYDDHDKFPAGHESVTFVGRPFPLEEAPQHFSRLRRWGLTFGTSHGFFLIRSNNEHLIIVRFLVTWEAVEHAGPCVILPTLILYFSDVFYVEAFTTWNT